jgi:hypothetical protein
MAFKKYSDLYTQYTEEEFEEFVKSKELKIFLQILKNSHLENIAMAARYEAEGCEEQAKKKIKAAACILPILWDVDLMIKSSENDGDIPAIKPKNIAAGAKTLVIPIISND